MDPFGTPASLVAPSPGPSLVRSMRSPSQHPLSLDSVGDLDNELPDDTPMSRYLQDAKSQPEQSISEESDRITDGFGTLGQPESTLVS